MAYACYGNEAKDMDLKLVQSIHAMNTESAAGDSCADHSDGHGDGGRSDKLGSPCLLADHNTVANGDSGHHFEVDFIENSLASAVKEGCPYHAKNGECKYEDEDGKNLSIMMVEEDNLALRVAASPQVLSYGIPPNDPYGFIGVNTNAQNSGHSLSPCSLLDENGSLKEKRRISGRDVDGKKKGYCGDGVVGEEVGKVFKISNSNSPPNMENVSNSNVFNLDNHGKSRNSCELATNIDNVYLESQKGIKSHVPKGQNDMLKNGGQISSLGKAWPKVIGRNGGVLHDFSRANVASEDMGNDMAADCSYLDDVADVVDDDKADDVALPIRGKNAISNLTFTKKYEHFPLTNGSVELDTLEGKSNVNVLKNGADQNLHKSPSVPSNVGNGGKVPTSYARVVNGSHSDETNRLNLNSIKLQFIPPNIVDGRIKVSPPIEVAEEGSAVWRNTLVGYFIGKRLPYQVVNSIAHKIWGKFGLMEVLTSDNGIFLFKFDSFQDACAVLDKAPWHMANRPLVLKLWQPSLPLTREEVHKVPVWVRLYNIPFEYWTSKGLSFVASAVGCPLHADHITLTRKRLSYARVCVEIDAREALIEDFDFQCSNGKWIPVKVEYEWVPQKCATCGVFGHTLRSCPRNDPIKDESKQWIPKSVVPSTTNAVSTKDGGVKQDEWVTVSRKKNGKATIVPPTCIPMDELPFNDIAKIVEEGECSSKGTVSITTLDDLKGVTPKALDVISLAIREEGECTPIFTRPHSSTKEDEIEVAPVDSDSSLSNTNQLAVRAKDSLEKKVKGRSGKHKKGSTKKGRKRQSPQGGRWR